MTVLLLTATPMEQALLVDALAEPVHLCDKGRSRRHGRFGDVSVELVESGLGAVNVASVLTSRLEATSPDVVVQVGVGGAYAGSGLHVGDLAVAASENDGDLGVVTPDGWHGADLIGLPVVERDGCDPFFNRFPVDETRSKAATDSVDGAYGPFVSVQTCSGTAALGAERERRVPGAIVENMEGAAAAQVCLQHDVPFVELRAISNLVEDRDTSRWDLPGASRRAQEAALRVLPEIAS